MTSTEPESSPPAFPHNYLGDVIAPINDSAQAARSDFGLHAETVFGKPSLTQRVTGAFALTIANTVGGKIVNLALQIILARLLEPRHFGLIALAYTVTTFIGLIQLLGLREVLIHRQRHFERWANSAFWLCMTSGVFFALLTCAIAPVAAMFYHRRELVNIVIALGVMIPITSLSLVPAARLSVEMRYGVLCGFNLFSTVLVAGLTILLACLGFGVYSFVWPRLIEVTLRAGVYWTLAPSKIRFNLQVGRWRFLLGDSIFAVAANATFMLTTQGDNMLLGLQASDSVVGVYYFAFNLSIQGVMLLVANLFDVLFPSLASIEGGPARQTDALLRAQRVLSVFSIPFCLFQAVTAGPIIHLFFGPRWSAAIPVIWVLASGMSFWVLGWPAQGLVQAQGRFRTHFVMAIASAGLFMAIVYTCISTRPASQFSGRWADAAFRTAVGVAIAYVITQTAYLYVAIRHAGRGIKEIISVFAGPYTVSIVASGAGWISARFTVSHFGGANWTELATILFVGGGVYAVLAWFFLPGAAQVVEMTRSMIRKVGSKK